MKLMKKYAIALLFIVCQINAMNETSKQDPSKPCDDICHLNRLPIEVLNYLASYLMESEEEFVERTKKMDDSLAKNVSVKLSSLQAWCPDEVSSIKIKNVPQEVKDKDNYLFEYNKYLVVKKDGIEYTTKLEDRKSDYRCVALSRGYNRIGIYRSESYYCLPRENINYRFFLEIQKIELKKNEKGEGIIVLGEQYKLPVTNPQWIGFNKQGNWFIEHSTNMFTQKAEHSIVDLKKLVNSALKEEIVHTHKLQTYLQDKFVCSGYIKGINSKNIQ